jgi:cell division protein FtsW (lipid II flippase)
MNCAGNVLAHRPSLQESIVYGFVGAVLRLAATLPPEQMLSAFVVVVATTVLFVAAQPFAESQVSSVQGLL